MAQNVYANGSAAKEIFVNQGGSWTTVKGVWVKDGGVWRQCFPAVASNQGWVTPGTYSFTVPNGIYSVAMAVQGGGGGGGGFYGNGDSHAGGGGGSGGYLYNSSVAVTPGETLTVIIGAGGTAASVEFNGVFKCTGGGTSGSYWNGTAGGSTMIKRGATVLMSVTGGQPGLGSGPGDNCSGSSGAGGSPGGVAGGTIDCNRNGYVATPGGDNGIGFGKGGDGNALLPGDVWVCPQNGGDGAANIAWS